MEPSRQTLVYKTAQDCRIQVDVYLPPGKKQPPALVWIHGGALIFGSRTHIPAWQLDFYLAAGYAVCAIDYRLAPETKLPAILDDLRDAFRWVRSYGAAHFNIDPERLAVVGHSAGGYLTLAAGYLVEPRPRALVAFYGYGNISTDWYRYPDPFYNQQARVTPEAARQGVGKSVISGIENGEDGNRRWLFYLYCRQQGLWPQEVAGYDPAKDLAVFKQFNPADNVTPAYPSTLLLHGDQDTDVPFSESENMAAALKAQGVPHRLVRMPGRGHGFDYIPEEPPADESERARRREVDNAFAGVLEFLEEHVKG